MNTQAFRPQPQPDGTLHFNPAIVAAVEMLASILAAKKQLCAAALLRDTCDLISELLARLPVEDQEEFSVVLKSPLGDKR